MTSQQLIWEDLNWATCQLPFAGESADALAVLPKLLIRVDNFNDITSVGLAGRLPVCEESAPPPPKSHAWCIWLLNCATTLACISKTASVSAPEKVKAKWFKSPSHTFSLFTYVLFTQFCLKRSPKQSSSTGPVDSHGIKNRHKAVSQFNLWSTLLKFHVSK